MEKFKISGLDLRALGMFRIIVGLNLIYNILRYRLFYIREFYTADGLMPRAEIARLYGEHFTLIDWLHEPWMVSIFMVLGLIIAAFYTLGFRPALTGFLGFIWLWSIIHYNPFLSHGVEFLIEVSLFWGMFLPLGERFSLFKPARPVDKQVVWDLPVFAILFQIAIIYLTSTITKTGEFWRAGVAVESVMGDLTHAGLLSGWLAQLPGLCKFLSYATLVIEGAIPLLIFSPIKNGYARLTAAVLLFGLHVSLGLSMEVGPFYLITTGFAVLLLPKMVWDKLKVPADYNFGQIHWTKYTFQPDVRQRLILKRVIALGIIGVLVLAFQKNLAKWRYNSYWSDTIKNNAVLDVVARLKTPLIGVSGIFRQSWWLFAPDPHKDMGCVIMTGILPDGKVIDLHSGKVLFQLDPSTGKFDTVNTPRVQATGAMFIYSFYIRRSYKDLDEAVFKNWAQYEYGRWVVKNPGIQLREYSLMLYSLPTSLEQGQLVRKPNLGVLHTQPL